MLEKRGSGGWREPAKSNIIIIQGLGNSCSPEGLHAVQQRQAAVVQRGVVCSCRAGLPLHSGTCTSGRHMLILTAMQRLSKHAGHSRGSTALSHKDRKLRLRQRFTYQEAACM